MAERWISCHNPYRARGQSIHKLTLNAVEFEAFCKRRDILPDERDSLSNFFNQQTWDINHGQSGHE